MSSETLTASTGIQAQEAEEAENLWNPDSCQVP